MRYNAQDDTLNGVKLTDTKKRDVFDKIAGITYDGMTESGSLGEEVGHFTVNDNRCITFYQYKDDFTAVSRYADNAPVYVRIDKIKSLLDESIMEVK